MSPANFTLILFLYYGGIETASEISKVSDFSTLLKLTLSASLAAVITGTLYFLLIKDTKFVLQFTSLPMI